MYAVDEFNAELNFIENQAIKDFTRYCLSNAPTYFFELPASSTGKYHPPDSNGVGGLVRHTRATAYVVKELSPAFELNSFETDAAVSAAILHDLCKYGMPGGEHTTSDHDVTASIYVKKLSQRFTSGGTEVPMLNEICLAIAYHFGNYTTQVDSRPFKQFPEQYSKIEQIVHIADMVASRKEVRFAFLEKPGHKVSFT